MLLKLYELPVLIEKRLALKVEEAFFAVATPSSALVETIFLLHSRHASFIWWTRRHFHIMLF